MSLAVWIDQMTLSILTMIVLVVIIAVGLWYINDMKREASEEEEPVTDEERLKQFEAARDAGELSPTEFERVRDALLKKKEEAVVSQPARLPTRDTQPPSPEANAPEERPPAGTA